MTDISTLAAEMREGIAPACQYWKKFTAARSDDNIRVILDDRERIIAERDAERAAREKAEGERDRWFETHLAHRTACDALGKANEEMFKRAIEAKARAEKAERERDEARAERDEFGEIGERDGYEKAVQDIDALTGGDGEYRFCTNGDPERHTPDPETMKKRIADRFASLTAENERMRGALTSIRELEPGTQEWVDGNISADRHASIAGMAILIARSALDEEARSDAQHEEREP